MGCFYIRMWLYICYQCNETGRSRDLISCLNIILGSIVVFYCNMYIYIYIYICIYVYICIYIVSDILVKIYDIQYTLNFNVISITCFTSYRILYISRHIANIQNISTIHIPKYIYIYIYIYI